MKKHVVLAIKYNCWLKIWIKDKEPLLKEGWIEEIKPREWWKLYRKGMGLLVADFKTKEEAQRYKVNNTCCSNDEIIKVREVLKTWK